MSTYKDKGLFKPLKPLTRKQKIFVDYLLNNPKATGQEAAMVAYNVGGQGGKLAENTARAIASETLTKPNVLAALQEADKEAQEVITSVMRAAKDFALGGGKEGAAYASVAKSSADSILDRLHGKATTRIESTQRVVRVNIDLTG